jgi:Fe-S cluster assembly ATP-binding protein
MLKITNLHANLADSAEEILHGIDLQINPGEVHFLMGPNGSGKSTLAKVLAGHPDYQITQGEISLDAVPINEQSASERSRMGLFLAFQYPVEVPGVGLSDFLRMAYNSHQEQEMQLPVFEFRKLLREKAAYLNFGPQLLERNLNEGFSGGEKKKTEVLQMAILEPRYAILDETDSGLDVDALKDVFAGINTLLADRIDPPGVLVITHYHRVFEYMPPHFVHVMKQGRIVESGGIELARRIDAEGYNG